MVPAAVPLAEMPLAQVAENEPEIDVEVWLVTCHEKPVQELAEMPDSGFDDQVPMSDGVLGAAGAGERCGQQKAKGYELLHRRDPGGVRDPDAHRVRVITKAVGP